MVERVDKVAQEILGAKKSNKYRDHFFPLMINSLNLKIGVEIGVDKADFSFHILSKTPMTNYYCVDTWQDNFGSNIYMKKTKFDADGDNRYSEATERLAEFGERVSMLRMSSMEAVANFYNHSLDFVYIDGDHSLEGIYEDIKAWTPKVRIGGIVAGHDYKDGDGSGITDYFGEQLPYRIKAVTDDYCLRHGFKLNTCGGVTQSWWFVKNKEA